jgi:hypothetical protein
MRTVFSAMIVLTALAQFGCSSPGGNDGGNGTAKAQPNQPTYDLPGTIGPPPATARTNTAGSNAARGNAGRSNAARVNTNLAGARPVSTYPERYDVTPTNSGPKSADVSVIKLEQSEVPAAVRAIERMIDRRSALLADNVRIEVSKNYEWDVSLSGDGVSPHRPANNGTVSEASGNPRACFRNLDIRARDKITVWRSGLGVTPFIRIYANGAVSYIDTDDATGKPRVKRAAACKIDNASIAFDEQAVGSGIEAAAAQPAALREKTK